jgi:O-antigen ligase
VRRAEQINREVLKTGARRLGTQTALIAYATACALAIGGLLLTNWPTYNYEIRGGAIPLYYYALPGILVLPIAFARPEAPLRVLRSPLFWWFAVYVLLGLTWQIVAHDFGEETSRQFRLRLLVFFLFATAAVLVLESNRAVVAMLIVACVLIAGAFNWFDALRPFRFVPQSYEHASEGRGAGLFLNPNVAGSFIVMGTIAALSYIPMRLRAVMLVCVVLCVAPTFSRGAFVLAGLMVGSGLFLGLLRRLQAVLILMALPLLVSGVNLGYEYLMTHSEDRNMQRVVQRLMVLKDAAEEDESVDIRADAAARGWQLFKQSPLFGAGLGATTTASFVTGPHNMYVTLMAEQGIFGLALYLSLLFLLAREGMRLMRSAATRESSDIGRAMLMFALCLAMNGFFSHNILDEAHTMFLMAFLAAAGLHAKHRSALRSSGRAGRLATVRGG